MTLCKPSLEKSLKETRTKFMSCLQGFHIKAISENTSKYHISNSKKDSYQDFTSVNLDAVSQQFFQKSSTTVEE